MNYPLIHTTFPHSPELLIPDPARIKETYEQLLSQNPATPFPFWARAWASGIAMTTFLHQENHWVRSKHVLEIGAGIGIPSFSIVHIATSILITDHADEAIELAKENITSLGMRNVKATKLDWNDINDDMSGILPAETVLLCDINYAPEQFPALLTMFKKFFDRGSTLILATPQRISAAKFMEAIQPFMKKTFQTNVDVDGLSTGISISVMSL